MREPTFLGTRVLFVINSLAGGGAERVMVTLLRHSGAWRDRHDMALALLDEEPGAYSPPEWLTVHCLGADGRTGRSLSRLRAFVGRWRPDVVVSFLTRSNIAAAFAVAGRGIPLVISERVNTHAHLGGGIAGKVSRALVRAAYPRARKVIAVSRGVADDLAARFDVGPDRLSVIANPVDGARIRALGAERCDERPARPYVAAMGRLTANKNFALLIEAFARSGIGGQLLILGEGPERPALERQVRELGLTGRVLLPGFSANPFPLLAAAQAYVLPSNAEGFPNGLVEAMALGVPVIATDCPSGPSEILAGRAQGICTGLEAAAHGLLVPCEDAEAMDEALRRIQDPNLRQDYAAAARARADAYAVEASVSQYWAVIEACLGGTTRGNERRAELGVPASAG